MTEKQKFIAAQLLNGCTIGGLRLRDPKGNPLLKVDSRTFHSLKDKYLRNVGLLFLIDKRKVRCLHNNSFMKKEYKKHLASTKFQNSQETEKI